RPAPVALGTHPYLRVGRVPTEELWLTVEAERHLVVDAALIPVGDEPVDDEVDLRRGHVLGRRERNTCYHGLTPHGSATEAGCGAVSGRGGIGGPAGHEALSRYRHVLTAPDGRAVHLWSDASFVYVQVYVTDRFPDPEVGTTRAVAVEPMTAAPDALNSGRGLRWLAPDERWDLAWGVRTVGWPGGEGPTGSPPS
ncbi:MAG: hypothetical protein HGA44_15075, partial [Cellulomonadaceae bacterium]|nr:hypothetical protein [Cellulomonadaceae bacterium]